MGQKKAEEMFDSRLGLEDQFEFKCDCCGKCCENRTDIILSALDLYRISKYLSRDIRYVIDRYCIVNIGGTSKVPIVLLKPVGRKLACPFLKNRKCSIHKAKPTVCELFPLGRFAVVADGEEKKMQYFYQNPGCGKKGYQQTVKDWIKNLTVYEEASQVWTEILTEWSLISNMVCRIKYSSEAMDHYYQILAHKLYLDYDLGRDFHEQIVKRKEELDEIRELIMANIK